MFFKNLQLYRLSPKRPITAESLHEQLAKKPFHPCGTQDFESGGWVAPCDGGEFVHAMIGGAVTQFYAGMRWPGREADCDALGLGEGFALWPPPFSVEGRDLALVSRRTVPIAELFAFCNDTARQLDGLRLTALTPQRLQRPAPPIRCGLASPIASHHIRPCPNG